MANKKSRTEEHKQKIASSLKGKKKTKKHADNIARARKGTRRIFSEAHKEKMKLAQQERREREQLLKSSTSSAT